MEFNNHRFLAQRLSSGDYKAFDYLVETYYQKLCVYAHKLTNDKENAEDIVQNVFTNVWMKHKKINPEFSIKSLLYKSVYNEFIDQYRKNQPVLYLEKRYIEAMDLTVENEDQNVEILLGQLELEISNLPKKCKRIFLLNKKEGLTHTEISEYLGISIKTIEGHMARAYKILSERLGEKFKTILLIIFGAHNIKTAH